MVFIKRFFIIAFLGLFILTGCEKEKVTPKTIFTSSFTLDYNTLQIKGDFKAKKDGEIEIDVTKPEKLKGLKIKTKQDEIFVTFMGITTSLTDLKVPNTAFYKIIKNTLTDILNNEEIEFKKQNDEYVFEEQTELGKAEIRINKNGDIKQIKLDEQGFVLKFNN